MFIVVPQQLEAVRNSSLSTFKCSGVRTPYDVATRQALARYYTARCCHTTSSSQILHYTMLPHDQLSSDITLYDVATRPALARITLHDVATRPALARYYNVRCCHTTSSRQMLPVHCTMLPHDQLSPDITRALVLL